MSQKVCYNRCKSIRKAIERENINYRIAYAIDQIVDLISQGVDGIHSYTMNNPYVAKRIYEAVRRLLAVQHC